MYNLRNLISTSATEIWNVLSPIASGVSLIWTDRNWIKAVFKPVWMLGEIILRTDPYKRFFDEMQSWIETETVVGGRFEGFHIYTRPRKNQTLFFPCIILDMERGNSDKYFGGQYGETGTMTIKLMFTRKHYITIPVDIQ